jgi:hypothetical protein
VGIVDIDSLIAEARAEIENPEKETVKVRLGRSLVEVEVSALDPGAWELLLAMHPPRKGAGRDANLGFDPDGAALDYPADRLRVGGEPITQEKWSDLYRVLDSVNRSNVQTLQWGLNVFSATKKLRELGKARTGGSPKKRTPPENSESLSDDSKDGNPQK